MIGPGGGGALGTKIDGVVPPGLLDPERTHDQKTLRLLSLREHTADVE